MRAVHHLWIIYTMVNVIAFAMYGIDKYRAKKNRWRIRESALLGITWLMGGLGAYAGMRVFRHKTKHTAFAVCAPLAAIIQLALMVFATIRLSGLL